MVLPSLLPHLLTGLRVATPYGIGGAVVAELVSANRGLGYLLQLHASDFDTAGVFAVLAVVALLVAIGNATLDHVSLRLTRGSPTTPPYTGGPR